MRIAVIDDERPSRSELKHLISQSLPGVPIDEADSAHGAIELAARNSYTAIFVDIHLGDMSGTDLCAVLKRMQPDVKVVFATAYDEYAIQAFEMDASDYIMKPFDPGRVRRAVDRVTLCAGGPAIEALQPCARMNKLSILTDKRVVVLDIPDIAYIETDSRCCIIHTPAGDYTSPQPLGYFEKKLADEGFFRVHKSFLVNLTYITELSPWFNGMYCAKLKGCDKVAIPVSRKQVKAVKDIFEI